MKKYIILLITAIIFSGIVNTVCYFTQSDEIGDSKTENTEDTDFLILVNGNTQLPENYSVSLCKTENGEYIAECIYPYFQDFFAAAEEQGFSPEITSGYRSEKAF